MSMTYTVGTYSIRAPKGASVLGLPYSHVHENVTFNNHSMYILAHASGGRGAGTRLERIYKQLWSHVINHL